MPQTFNCPSCNAPLDYDGGELTIRCPYCNNAVIVPEELRPKSPEMPAWESAGVQMITADMDLSSLVGQATRYKEIVELARQGNKIEAIKRYRQLTGLGLKESKDAVEALIAGQSITITTSNMVASPVGSTSADTPQVIVPKAVTTGTVAAGAAAAGGISCFVWLLVVVIALVTVIPILIALAVPGGPLEGLWLQVNPASFARLSSSFGGEGSGPGLFTDPRAVAVDGDGNIYIAEYSDGRIQRFNASGEYQSQWNIGEEPYVGGMAATREGMVYVVYRGKIERYEGATGALIDAFNSEGAYSFDDLALTPDGKLLTITRGESIQRFRSDGQPDLTIEAAISSVSGDSELDTHIAVDGLGNIYALGTFNNAVFKFSPEGQFITRFGSDGDEAGQFRAPSAITVDGQGRVYISDIRGIQVFDSDGRYLDSINTEGVVFGMAINANNQLVAVSNHPKVLVYTLP